MQTFIHLHFQQNITTKKVRNKIKSNLTIYLQIQNNIKCFQMIKPGERYACQIWTIISQCPLTEIANSFFQVSDHHVPDISALRPCVL